MTCASARNPVGRKPRRGIDRFNALDEIAAGLSHGVIGDWWGECLPRQSLRRNGSNPARTGCWKMALLSARRDLRPTSSGTLLPIADPNHSLLDAYEYGNELA